MLPNASHFSINDGVFTEIHSDNVNHSTNYNVYIVGDFQNEIERGSRPALDEAQWKKLVANIENLVKKPDDSEEAQTAVADESTSEEEQRASETQTNTITNRLLRFIIYTNTDDAKKKLKSSTQLVFTLTPPGSPPFGRSWPTIVWKVLEFQPNTSKKQEFMWSDETAFCVVNQKNNSTFEPGRVDTDVVRPGHVAVLQDIENNLDFSLQVELPVDSTAQYAIFNKTETKEGFALCVVDRTRPETDQLCPVVNIDGLRSDEIFMCGPPVMLQAYAISGYKERRLIDTHTINRALFQQPIDVRKLGSKVAFRLYADRAGKIILERD
ncbi:hypothetical protein FPV67DRAFT_273297 [Lyophyllum atratum]|nr:hypothetical protein FPV67DRAFT_273297 [Lyophyllum atratum]